MPQVQKKISAASPPSLADVESSLRTKFDDALSGIRNQLAKIETYGSHRHFLVNRMGSTGSSWLAKLVNSHPDAFCYHEGVLMKIFPATSYGSDEIVTFIRWLAEDDMRRAYGAIGDVGSVWKGHIVCMPKGLFTTGVLVRHPARMLNTRLQVFKSHREFTEISADSLQHIEQLWGIEASRQEELDQIFLQDLYNFIAQIETMDAADVVIHLESMSDLHYCCDVLHQLTGLYYDRSLVLPFINNPVNQNTASGTTVKKILESFTQKQREWYWLMLENLLPHAGYRLDDDQVSFLRTSNQAEQSKVAKPATHVMQVQTIEENDGEKDREIARLRGRVDELENVLNDVQNSATWRLVGHWRRARRWILPPGSRRRRAYDSVLNRFRGKT